MQSQLKQLQKTLSFHGHWAITGFVKWACLGDQLHRGLQQCGPLYVADTANNNRVLPMDYQAGCPASSWADT
eukprot:13320341-Ditylum_brightwellii.AAC.1